VLRLFCILLALGSASLTLSAQSYYPERPRDLSGYWHYQLDRTDSGVNQKWFANNLQGYIRLPGIVQNEYFGGDAISTNTPWVLSLYDRYWFLRDDYKQYTDEKNIKVPFLSQPPRHYLGVVWYQRDIDIPTGWAARRVVLTLERPHWETTVWIDEKRIGSDRSLVAPHVYDLGSVTPGRHRLTIRVDNRMLLPYRPDAHSVSDSLGASWNGIVGRIDLSTTSRVWIEDAQVFPDLARHVMVVKAKIGNQTGRAGEATLTAIWPDVAVVPVNWDENGGTAEMEVPLRNDAPTWDEFSPKLQQLRLWLKGNGVEEYRDIQVGLRDFRAAGKEFRLNDRPINFRGTHSGGDFPLTGYPDMTVAYWRALFQLCRKWGLNHMRFHSWCPPEAAFQAADEVGFYLQPEPGMWNEISPDTPMERMLYEETDRMIKAYGNHPSFMLLSASNEPKGRWKEALAKWVEHYHKQDPRRLYANGTGHTEREVPDITQGTDYLAIQRIGAKMLRRESGWFGNDFGQSLVDIDVPVIAHEVGQWVAYPDYEIIKSFKGYLKPGNFEIFRDSLKQHGLLEKNGAFVAASGHFQLECYKEEIEANLRTPGLGGFQLLDLHDYVGQGTALVGLLDPFWKPKSYVTAEDFKEFCNTTVPLARLRQRVFTTTEPFNVEVEVAHFGPKPLENVKAVWRLVGGGPELQGEWQARTIEIGKNIPIGNIVVDLSKLKAPAQLKLIVTIAPASAFGAIDKKIIPAAGLIKGETYFENHWDFWLFPPVANTESADFQPSRNSECAPSAIQDLLITNSLEEAEAKLAKGGKVLFSPRPTDLEWTSPPLDTIPVFWNRQMGPGWGRMLGLWIDRKPGESRAHTLDGFPTGPYFDWQWAQIMGGVRAINLDRLPEELEPVIWAVDDWNRNYKLGLVFECIVGRGRLLVSAIDVTKPSNNPVLERYRQALVVYARSDCFQPVTAVSLEALRSLFFDTRIMVKLRAQATVGGISAGVVIDGDPNTFLLVGDQKSSAREQVDIVINFPAPVTMSGVLLMGRQNHREHEGDIKDFSIEVSDDGNVWSGVARGELLSTFAPQTVNFSRPITTRYLKLVSLTGFGADKTTSLADLAIIYAGPKLNESGGPMEYQRNRSATPDIDEGPVPKPKPTPSPK